MIAIKKGAFGKLVVTYPCPHCRDALRNSVDMVGKVDHCPACGTEHTVPGEEEVSEYRPDQQQRRRQRAAERAARSARAAREKEQAWRAAAAAAPKPVASPPPPQSPPSGPRWYQPTLVAKLGCLSIVLPVLALVALGLWEPGTKRYGGSRQLSREEVLQDELQYLDKIPEIAWVEIDSNNIYIGFTKIPEDFQWVIRGAALRANRAINFGAHVWAVDANQRHWRPGDGPYHAEVTARYGRVER